MTFYSKLAAALIGLAVIIAGRYGFDLTGSELLLTDAVGSIIAAVGVWLAKNKPATPEQVVEAQKVVTEGAIKVQEKQENSGP